MNYKKYRNSRDASWEILLDLKIDTLPIPICKILHGLEIKLVSYNKNIEYIAKFGLNEVIEKTDGFTVRNDNTYIIFYDNEKSVHRKRFTLAHELGHIMLNHIKDDKFNKFIEDEEIQANIFASRLLAPAFLIHEMQLFTVEEIVDTFNISREFAKIRLERAIELEKRNKEFLAKRGYGCFYISELERKLSNQFMSK